MVCKYDEVILMSIIDKFTEIYSDKNFYLRKKAEYSFFFVLTMLGAILLIVITEIFLKEDIILSMIRGSATVTVFALTLYLIYKGFYEAGVNLMIVLGFVRLLMIINYSTPFQFYAMVVVILISVNVIHSKNYQPVITSIGAFTLLIYEAIHIRQLVDIGILEPRSFSESLLTIYLFIAIIFLLRIIRRIINREILEHEQLLEYAEKDSLTSIYNRRKITETFEEKLLNKETFELVLFDIDDFKKINDTYGHDVGDEVLIELSTLIKENYSDLSFARWGGEEFLLLSCRDNETSEKIRKTIMNHKFTRGIKLTISVGVTFVKRNDTIHSAFKRADDAMYYSKKTGKNKITVM
jgi:diguanylate cyclase (GGDEF)-like protein